MTTASDIHPTAFVGDGVDLGADVRIGPHAVVLGPARIGNRVWIGPGAVIGGPPEISSMRQNTAWSDDVTYFGVMIGDDTVIREHSIVTQGSHRSTVVGARCWLLASSYVAHDVLLGADVTLSAGARLGGHCVVGDAANLGMNASVHQRRVIGGGAMIGMGAVVTRDVPPFAKAYGSPLRLRGANRHVLARNGAPEELSIRLESAFATSPLDLSDFADDPHTGEFVRAWLSFIDPDRGATPPA